MIFSTNYQYNVLNINFTSHQTLLWLNRVLLTIYDILQDLNSKYWNIIQSFMISYICQRLTIKTPRLTSCVRLDQLLPKHTWAQFIILIDKCQLLNRFTPVSVSQNQWQWHLKMLWKGSVYSSLFLALCTFGTFIIANAKVTGIWWKTRRYYLPWQQVLLSASDILIVFENK